VRHANQRTTSDHHPFAGMKLASLLQVLSEVRIIWLVVVLHESTSLTLDTIPMSFGISYEVCRFSPIDSP
jgi:hypothetical protein